MKIKKTGGEEMLTYWFKKNLFLKAIVFVVAVSICYSTVFASDSLKTLAAKKTGATDDIKGELKTTNTQVGFKLGYMPNAIDYMGVSENIATKTSSVSAAVLSELALRGLSFGLDSKKDKARISGIKDGADVIAKRIYEMVTGQEKVILMVRVSEGFGRDEVAESFKANDAVVPPELLGETELIKNAIEAGKDVYVSKAGETYRIENAIIDVIEGTNSFVTDVERKPLSKLADSESGATSVIVTGSGVASLGNCPDIYTDSIFTTIPKDKKLESGFISNPLDPEEVAKNPQKITELLTRIAKANNITVNDMEVVLMDRPREAEKLAVLKALKEQYPGLEIVTIKDGTVAHCLLATFGRKEGKHKVVMTVGGAPEGFMNLAVVGLFKDEGAIASVRVYSKNVNKVSDEKDASDAKNLNRRYAFSGSEKEEILTLRPADGQKIIDGVRLFTQDDVKGDVEGSFSFITNNGVFGVKGAERQGDGSYKVKMLRVGKVNEKPAIWFEDKIIPVEQNAQFLKNAKDTSWVNILIKELALAEDIRKNEQIITALRSILELTNESDEINKVIRDTLKITKVSDLDVLSNKAKLNFANVKAVNAALKDIVEVSNTGVKVLNVEQLRGSLIDKLVYDATFNPDKEVVALCRKLIKDIAASQGIAPRSVYELYVEKAKDTTKSTTPAINVRGMAYNTARAIFESANAKNVGTFILEIAKSEIKYSGQRPAEYTTSILAAAIKEGYNHPIFLQGDHFQISLEDYAGNIEKKIVGNSDKAREDIKKLIREAVEAGFYQIDLDMSPLVDFSKPTTDEQQKDNYTETAILTAYVRALEREFGLDKLGITVNLGGEIGEIGKGLDKGRNSTVEDFIAFDNGYKKVLTALGEKAGYELKPITKIAVQTGTKHGGIMNDKGEIEDAKVSFNTLAEIGKAARERGYAGVVQHGASTLDPRCFVVFAGKSAPIGFKIAPELLDETNKEILSTNPVAEVHLATEYQNTIFDHPAFPKALAAAIEKNIKQRFPTKKASEEAKEYKENRKNAWVSFKAQAWNLDADTQGAIRESLKEKFNTVFENMGVVDTLDKVASVEKAAQQHETETKETGKAD
ncbi:MAG: fructose-bisphosphatase class II [Candidatus Omnitrophica bacterium]|nr:fructose-bisphosphatase class II [Candidatus Omnitrophota bacterium]